MGAALASEYRVGPKGYIHGWIFVGAPGVGGKVFHPSLGHGTVTGHGEKHVTVAFGSGEHSFEHRPSPEAPHLEAHPAPERVTSKTGALQSHVTTAQRNELKAEVKAAKKDMSPAEAKTVEQWATGKGMVRRIQQGTVSDATAAAFDDAMHRLPKVNGLVYRGVAPGSLGEKRAEGRALGLRAGDVMDLDEPVSTSVDPKQSAGFGGYIYEIESPSAAYLAGIASQYEYEQEAVLAPGRFKVVSVEAGKIDLRGRKGYPVRIIRLVDVTAGKRSWRSKGKSYA